MKKRWNTPTLEVLDVKNTFNGQGHQNGTGGGANQGGIPGCNPSGNKPQKCPTPS